MKLKLFFFSEPIEISVVISNTIGCGIILSYVEPLWRLKLDNDEELSNMCLFESNAESPSKIYLMTTSKLND